MMLITRGFGDTAEGIVSGFEIAVSIDESLVIDLDIDDQTGRAGDMKYKLKQGEGKVLAFTITKGGVSYDTLDGVAGLTFVVKKNKRDEQALISKSKDDFTITDNVANLPITSDDTRVLAPGNYIGELTIVISTSDTSKSADIQLEIERAVAVAA